MSSLSFGTCRIGSSRSPQILPIYLSAIDGRDIEVVGDEDGIALTGPTDVLQPLIDAGDLERLDLDGEEEMNE